MAKLCDCEIIGRPHQPQFCKQVRERAAMTDTPDLRRLGTCDAAQFGHIAHAEKHLCVNWKPLESSLPELLEKARDNCRFCGKPMTPQGKGVSTCDNPDCKAPQYTSKAPLASPAGVTPEQFYDKWIKTHACRLGKPIPGPQKGCYVEFAEAYAEFKVSGLRRTDWENSSERSQLIEGNAVLRAKVSELEAQLQQAQDSESKFAKVITTSHAVLDRAKIPSAMRVECNDDECNSQLVHRIKEVVAELERMRAGGKS